MLLKKSKLPSFRRVKGFSRRECAKRANEAKNVISKWQREFISLCHYLYSRISANSPC